MSGEKSREIKSSLLARFERLAGAFPELADHTQKQRFKDAYFERKKDFGEATIDLAPHLEGQERRASLEGGVRRSARKFSYAAVTLAEVACLLSGLKARRDHSAPSHWRYPYASASAMYAVTPYLVVHKRAYGAGVQRLDVGGYVYDQRSFAVSLATPGRDLPVTAYAQLNQPVFTQAAFSIFLVVDFSVLYPVYGPAAVSFAFIEAGLMAQLIDNAALLTELGVAHVGGVDPAALTDVLQLSSSQLSLHSFTCGLKASEG